jgi:hypothetical protein
MHRTRILFALFLVVAAGRSSGGTKVSAGAATTTTAAAGQAGFQAYSDCLKQHGVDMPARTGQPPGGGQRPPRSLPPGVDQKTFDAAQTACASKRPTGGFGGGGGGGRGGGNAPGG